MAGFCLIPAQADKFMQSLKDGKIDPYKIKDMTSEERHNFFGKIVGEENAKGVNSLFESKILLKNQKYAYTNWAKKVAGLTPEVRRDLITRISKMDRILNPAEEKQFLHDLAATRLGVDVTASEAKHIADLSKNIESTKAKAKETGIFKSEGDRLAYGRAKVALGDYVNGLKNQAGKQGVKGNLAHPLGTVSKVAGVAKSVKASLDDSAIFRQGWKSMWTNPIIWERNARRTFIDAAKELRGKNVMKEVDADIVSRPNYDRMTKAKLAISTIEEAYPSHLPGKVPVLGRFYKASESAYEGFVYRQRADIFDKYMEIAKKSGVNIDDRKQLESIGKLVNALTGRGYLGAGEKVANNINNVFFAPRFVKSNVDLLTAHQLQKGVTKFVRVQAAKNLVKVILGTSGVLAIANLVKPGSVELDPRSSNFGKIKIGDTRFDVSGGIAGIPTLAARLITQSTKSASGVKKLNTGYGSQTGQDVVVSYLTSKGSPMASVINDIVKQQDFQGNKPTVTGEAKNLFMPLPITNIQELRSDPQAANTIAGALADAFGIAVNTYGQSNKTWSSNPTKQVQAFQQKVSPQKFTQANKEYNNRINMFLRDHQQKLNSLPPNEKQSVTTAAKAKIETMVMKKYGFDYKKPKASKQNQQAKKNILQTVH